MTDADDAGVWPRGRSRHGGIDHVPLPPMPTGGLWLCGKHAVGPDPEAALRECGATTVVCLTQEHELHDRYPTYVDWLRTNVPLRAVWLPVPDLHAPSLADAETLLDELVRRLLAGEGLLMHCAAGIGRAGTMAACLLVRLGVPADDALHHVAQHRPMAGPEAGVQADLVRAVAGRC